VRYLRLVLPAVALMLSMAACGDNSDDSGIATTGDLGSDAQGPDAEERDAMLEFAECMRDHGVDMEDPSQDGGFTFKMEDDPESQEAYEACRHLAPGGGEPPELDAEGKAAMREFAECLRDEGIDMPDPSADGALTMPDGVTPEDPEFEAAMEECQDIIDGYPLMMRGGPGAGQ
jgi:hypothetical protein